MTISATLDTDIFIESTPKNAQRARKALMAFGYDLSDVSIEDLLKNKVLIRQYLVEADIHFSLIEISASEWLLTPQKLP